MKILNFKNYCRLMQKAYLFSLQIVMPAANCISVFPIVGCCPVGWPVQEAIGKSAANSLRISYTRLKKCASFRLFISDFRTYGNAIGKSEINSFPYFLHTVIQQRLLFFIHRKHGN